MNKISSHSIDLAGIKGMAAHKVFLALLLAHQPMTYSEIIDATGILPRSLTSAMDELRYHGIVQVTRNGRAFEASLTNLVTTAKVGRMTVREMCEQADETGSQEAKRRALQAAWDAWFPKKVYPASRLTDRAADDLLRLTGNSAVAFYDRASQATAFEKGEMVKHPLGYIKGVLINQNTNASKPAQPAYTDQQEEEQAVDLDPMRAWLRNEVAAKNKAS